MSQRNVLGGELLACSFAPLTGYFRDGCCKTGSDDPGTHVVCARMTEEFLEHSQRSGNDLSTPQPQFRFAGLRPGDRWCLCATRWIEAAEAGVAPPVVLASTHVRVLEYVPLALLKRHALAPV